MKVEWSLKILQFRLISQLIAKLRAKEVKPLVKVEFVEGSPPFWTSTCWTMFCQHLTFKWLRLRNLLYEI